MQKVKVKIPTVNSVVEEKFIAAPGFFLFGFFIARFMLFERYTPLGLSVFAAFSFSLYGFSVMLGSLLGMVSIINDPVSIQLLSASLIVVGIRILFGSIKDFGDFKFFEPLLSFSIFLTTGLASMIGKFSAFSDYIILIFESILSFFGVILFKKAEEGLKKTGSRVLSPLIKASILISGALLLLSVSQVNILGISPGRITALLIVIMAGYSTGILGGTTVGTILGAAYALQDSSLISLSLAMSFGGFISGIAARGKKTYAAVLFALSFGGALYYLGNTGYFYHIAEGVISSLIFILIKTTLLNKLSDLILGLIKKMLDNPALNRQSIDFIKNKFEKTTKAITEMSEVDERGLKLNLGNISEIFTRASDRVCRRCGLSGFCWGEDYNSVMDSLNKTIPILKLKGKLEIADIEEPFSKKCVKLKDFITEINNQYVNFQLAGIQIRDINSERQNFLDQFKSFSFLLNELTEEIDTASRIEVNICEKVSDYFKSIGVNTINIVAYTCKNDRLVVEAVLSNLQGLKDSDKPLLDYLEELTSKKGFDIYIEKRDSDYYCLITEKENFGVKIIQSGQVKPGEAQSGDNVAAFKTKEGKYYVILSDGMGSGEKARRDSKFVSTYIERLLKSGISVETCLKMVNTAFCLRCTKDEFATVDMLIIDLYTGKAEIIKAGAAPAFVIRGSKCFKIESNTMPLGIMQGSDIERTKFKLIDKDKIILGSDGVFAQGEEGDGILEIISSYKENSKKTLPQLIMDEAVKKREGKGFDDMTVVEVKFFKK